MLTKARLKTRIVAGFALAGAVSVVVLGASLVSSQRVTQRFERFAALHEQAQAELKIAQLLSDLQASTQIYTLQGQESAALNVHRKVAGLKSIFARQALSSRPDAASPHMSIVRHLDLYLQTFEQVERERSRRTELVGRDLVQAAAVAEAAVSKIRPRAGVDPDIAVRELLRAQRSARRYFDSLDSTHVRSAKSSIALARTALGVISAKKSRRTAGAVPGPSDAPDVVELLDAYEACFLEAVQRTRGYLYLVNVVMAAEASEVRYTARALERSHAARVADEVAAFEADVYRVSTITTSTATVALLLLVAFSITLLRSITEPIESLSRTFRELAHGSKDTVIPPHPVDDEIGELTAAASVFRSRNIETERLLEQSRALTINLSDKQAELARSNEELEQFVYTVSHDLKSPVVTSMGFIAIAKRLASRGDVPGAIKKLDRIVQANERMGQLINDLLELSRVGRVDIEMQLVELSEVLKILAESQQLLLQGAGLELRIVTPLPPIWGNEGRIFQVFENLLSNAIKYAGAPVGHVVEVGAREERDSVLVYVRDDGPGVDEAYHEKVFGLFQRLTADAPGTGIGLTIVRKIMRFHGGESWVESSPGRGATFWLRFPRPEEAHRSEH